MLTRPANDWHVHASAEEHPIAIPLRGFELAPQISFSIQDDQPCAAESERDDEENDGNPAHVPMILTHGDRTRPRCGRTYSPLAPLRRRALSAANCFVLPRRYAQVRATAAPCGAPCREIWTARRRCLVRICRLDILAHAAHATRVARPSCARRRGAFEREEPKYPPLRTPGKNALFARSRCTPPPQQPAVTRGARTSQEVRTGPRPSQFLSHVGAS